MIRNIKSSVIYVPIFTSNSLFSIFDHASIIFIKKWMKNSKNYRIIATWTRRTDGTHILLLNSSYYLIFPNKQKPTLVWFYLFIFLLLLMMFGLGLNETSLGNHIQSHWSSLFLYSMASKMSFASFMED